MKASTPRTSRLAAVANARRRQRKERMSAGSPMAAQSPMAVQSPIAAKSPIMAQSPIAAKSPLATRSPMANSMKSPMAARSPMGVDKTSPEPTFEEEPTSEEHAPLELGHSLSLSTSSGSPTTRGNTSSNSTENNENINHVNTISTLPTDEESISTWSQAQSTISGFTDDSFGFVSTPSKSFSSPKSPRKMPATIKTARSRKPKNISIITEEVLSPTNGSNITFRGSMGSPNLRNYTPSPRTPKMSGGNAFSEDTPRGMMKRIDELTTERDRLRLDSNLYKRKLHEALEAKAASEREKDDRIAELMKSIGNLTVLIDEADVNRNQELTEARKQYNSDSKTIKEMEQELSDTVCQLNKLRGAYEMLKQQRMQGSDVKGGDSVKKMEDELVMVVRERDELEKNFDECIDELGKAQQAEEVNKTTIKNQTATIDALKKELAGKEELESNFDECVEELGRLQGESDKQNATIKRQTATIDSIKKQLETSMAKAKTDISQKEQKITDILDEKFEMETALQQRIYELEGQLKSSSNTHKEDKHNYESIIKMLREKLDAAEKDNETDKVSLVQGMEEMKQGFTESVEVYKKKVADLESKLKTATETTESVQKELSDAKFDFVTRLQECTRERNETASVLKRVMNDYDKLEKDFEDAKIARGKDLKMLESELEKAYESKLVTDKQLQDTRRQLSNALHSLDEMAMDGGRMKTNLDGVMKEFHAEKDALHRELVELRRQTEEQRNTIYRLNQDNRRSDQTCTELRNKIRDLEKNQLEKATSANGSPTITVGNNSTLERQIEQLRASDKSKSMELSQAKQTIQKLKTKEKYLESRVESLANQITSTVQEYETRLGETRDLGRI